MRLPGLARLGDLLLSEPRGLQLLNDDFPVHARI
jgi:hypothetical protein